MSLLSDDEKEKSFSPEDSPSPPSISPLSQDGIQKYVGRMGVLLCLVLCETAGIKQVTNP